MGDGRTEKGTGRLQKTYCFVFFFVSAWPFHTGERLLVKEKKRGGGGKSIMFTASIFI